jgi:hypothetical protein
VHDGPFNHFPGKTDFTFTQVYPMQDIAQRLLAGGFAHINLEEGFEGSFSSQPTGQ